ncbi:MAG: hypothetical protein RDV48_18925 [Candidatus Eremiobacteraeota bacterium]|nr:hypothetical protein [Candidatus Eremiobacteraeota bacterium]
MEAINRSPISCTKKPSNIITSSLAERKEKPSAPSLLHDEVHLGHNPDMPQAKRLSFKPCSALKSLLGPSLARLSIIGFGLLCEFGSIAAQPLSNGNLPGGAGNENIKDRIETVVEKPETVYDSIAGKTIAKCASTAAKKLHTTGYCYRGVKAALQKSGITLTGKFAYQGATQLAAQDSFKEIPVSVKDLQSLQPGSVVVWSKSREHPYGHISIALGDGREASDHIEKQMTERGHSTFRVFIPVKDAPLEREPALDYLIALTPHVSVQASR